MVYAYTPNFTWIHLLYNLPQTKNRNFWQMLTFRGLLYPAPFNDHSQIWYVSTEPLSTLMCQTSSWSVYFVTLEGENPQILQFFGLQHFLVLPIEGVETAERPTAQLKSTNLPLSNGIKLVSILQCIQGKIVHTIPSFTSLLFTSVMHTHTNKKLHVFGCPGGRWNPSHTKVGMVIEDFEHILASQKLLGIQCTVWLQGGTENSGNPSPQLQ